VPKIRTTNEPSVERDVSEAEAADLRAWGLVLDSTKATTDVGLQKAAERQVAASTTEQQED
jgi:hypothetical protein